MRATVFPEFFYASVALVFTLLSGRPKVEDIYALAPGVLLQIEDQFESETANWFAPFKDSAIYYVSTLRRTFGIFGRLLTELVDPARSLSPSALALEGSLGEQCLRNILWGVLHLECLRQLLRFRREPMYEIVAAVVDGCGSAVPAYSAARRIYGLRKSNADQFTSELTDWDDEDQRLAALSHDERESTIES